MQGIIRVLKKINKSLLVSLGISLLSLFIASFSLFTSMEANKISEDINNYEKSRQSYEIVDQTYSVIYDNPKYEKIIQDLKENKIASNSDDLKKVIDVFENLGGKYCQGLVNHEHTRASLENSLKYICNNNQVYENFNGKKNGTALLCYKFTYNSKFSTTFKQETLKTCKEVR